MSVSRSRDPGSGLGESSRQHQVRDPLPPSPPSVGSASAGPSVEPSSSALFGSIARISPVSPPTPAPSPRPQGAQRLSSHQRFHSGLGQSGSGSSIAGPDADQTAYSDLDQDDLDGAAPSFGAPPLHPPSWPLDPQSLTRAATALLPTIPSSARVTLLSDLLLLLSSQELAQISSFVQSRLRIDFLSALPIEVSLHVLSFIDDPLTLARASQVNRFWRSLVNDEHTWEAMCLKYRYRYRRPSTVYPKRARQPPSSVNGPSAADSDLLASLYKRYRERGLDPSNARDELRTLHDLFLAKQSADPNAMGPHASGSRPNVLAQAAPPVSEMSTADLRFYEQLEQIVQEESRERYGGHAMSPQMRDQASGHDTRRSPLELQRDVMTTPRAVERGSEGAAAVSTATSTTTTPHVGWLSAGPPSTLFPRAPTTTLSRLSPLTGSAALPAFDPPRAPAEQSQATALPSSWTSGLGLPWGLSDLISRPAALGGSSTAQNGSLSVGSPAPPPAMAGIRSPMAGTLPQERPGISARRTTSDQWAHRGSIGLGRPPSQRSAREGSPMANIPPPGPDVIATQRAATYSAGVPFTAGRSGVPPNMKDSETFSYKAHFKRNYLTESNWHRGGHLLTHHVSTESGSVCTCLAMDQRWLVVGMANGKIHLFDARTGLFERTLQGRHDSGVWCLALISKTTSSKGKSRTKESTSPPMPSGGSKGKEKARAKPTGRDVRPYASQETAADGTPQYATHSKDLRLVRHDPRLTSRIAEPVDGAGRSTGTRFERRSSSDDQTLLWFHRARQALDSHRRRLNAGSTPFGEASVQSSAPTDPAQSTHSSTVDGQDLIGGLPRDLVEAGPDFVAESLMAEARRSVSQTASPEERRKLAQRIDSLKADITQIRQEHGITGLRRIPRPAMQTTVSEDVEMSDDDAGGGPAGPAGPTDSERADGDGEEDEEEDTEEVDYEGFSMGIGGSAHGLGTLCSSTKGFGNDVTLLVSGGCDRELKVWNLETGEILYKLRGHLSTVRCLRVLEGRPIAISGGRDATVRVWDISRGKEVRILAGHQNSVRCMEVAGNRAATGSYDCTCRVWDVDTGECLHVLRGHYNQIYCIGFDGNKVATGSLDSTVRVWSAETGEPLALLQGHTALVGQLQLTNNMLISGGSDGRIIAYSLDPTHSARNKAAEGNANQGGSGGSGSTRTRPRGSASGNTPAAAATATTAVAGGGASTARNSFTLLYAICAHDNSVSCLQFDEHFILTGGNDGTVRLWNLYDGSFVRELVKPTAGIWKLAFRDDKVVWVAKQEDESLSLGVVDFRPVEEGIPGITRRGLRASPTTGSTKVRREEVEDTVMSH